MQISVIIPSYNRGHIIQRAIDSVLAQTYLPNEIIVIDDGSTDNTVDSLQEKYSQSLSGITIPKIKILLLSHRGVSAARNAGVATACGEWVAFLDSDDAWQPDKLQEQVKLLSQSLDQSLEQSPTYHLCHTNEIWIRDGRRVNPMDKHQKRGGHIFPHCLPLCCISPSSVLINKSIFCELGGFDESLPACEDYDLWLRFCARYSVLYLDQPLTIKYGGHADQLSRQYWGMDRFRIQALDKLLRSGVLTAKDHALAKAMRDKKIMIYLQGARKRNKVNEIEYYEQLLAQPTG